MAVGPVMSWRALLGLLALHGFLLVIGTLVVWAARGLRTVSEALRLGGLSYLVGLASFGIVSVELLVVGVPYRLPTMIGIGLAIGLGAAAVGLRRGRALPALRGASGAPPLTLAIAPLVALVVVVGEALLRRGRLEPLLAYDAWAFWVPKAQAIHAFGGLDDGFFETIAGPSYPPLVPALEATAFRFMGGVDVVTLHLLFWGFAVAFVWAVWGVLAPRVRPLFLWPSLLLLVAAPDLVNRALQPQADMTLDWLFAAAVLLLALWVVEQRPALLAGVVVLLGAVVVTKREGLLLAACVVAAALAATWRTRRSTWPVLLAGAAALAAVALPWRVWIVLHDLPGGGPESGGVGLLSHLGRAWSSLRLSVETLVEPDLWLVVVPVVVVVGGLAWDGGARRLAGFALSLVGLLVLGSTWVMWSFPSLPLTQNPAVSPIVRLTGATVVAAAVLLPLLLERAWGGRVMPGAPVRQRAALGLVVLVALAYPVASGALGASFPSRDECARVATSDADGELELVYGRFDSPLEAVALRDQVVAVGFVGTEVKADGCGRWKVSNDGVEGYVQSQGTIAEARAAGFDPHLEVDPG